MELWLNAGVSDSRPRLRRWSERGAGEGVRSDPIRSDPIGTRYIISIIYIIVFLLEKQQEVHMELWLNAGVSDDLFYQVDR